MKALYIFFLFIVLAVVQIYIPAQMIFHQEGILKTGKAFKFKTKPIDPSNPFQGKYIRLNFEVDKIYSADTLWNSDEDIYVLIEDDSLGYARPTNVSSSKPDAGDYVKAKVDWYNSYEKELQFSLPFTEFYMEESKAYDAEKAYTKLQRDSQGKNVYALVYIKNGEAVLTNVFVDDVPIADYVQK